MPSVEQYDRQINILIESLSTTIKEELDPIVVEDEYIQQNIRGLAELAIHEHMGPPDGDPGEEGIIEYYGDMDRFPLEDDT